MDMIRHRIAPSWTERELSSRSTSFSIIPTYRLRASLPNQNAVVVNIGDGILDAMAYPYSDAFIGYTGVTTKQRAMEQAMLIVDNFSELTQAISASN